MANPEHLPAPMMPGGPPVHYPRPLPPAVVHRAAPFGLPPERRAEILMISLHQAAANGWRVESQGMYNATLVSGQPVNHVLHVLIGTFTCGLWFFVWAILAMSNRQARATLFVDQAGQVHWQTASS